jgi:hypothetical protein
MHVRDGSAGAGVEGEDGVPDDEDLGVVAGGAGPVAEAAGAGGEGGDGQQQRGELEGRGDEGVGGRGHGVLGQGHGARNGTADLDGRPRAVTG